MSKSGGRGNFPLNFVLSVTGDQQVASKFNNLKSNLQGTNAATTPLNKNLAVTDGNINRLGKSTDSTGKKIGNSKQPINQTATVIDDFGKKTDATGKKMDGIASKFQRNKGTIFGLTMLSSGLIEAAGMWSMYGDQMNTVKAAEAELQKIQKTSIEDTKAYKDAMIHKAEALEKIAALEKAGKTDTVAYQKAKEKLAQAEAELTEMQEKGIEGTEDYKKASEDLADAQKGLRFVQRNMILSMTDLIPMTLLAASGFIGLKDSLNKADKPLNTVGKSVDTLSRITPRVSADIGTFGKHIDTVGKSAPAAATSVSKFGGALTAIKFGAIGLAIVGVGAALYAIHTNAFGARDALNSVGKAIGDAIPGLVPFLNLIKGIAGSLGLIPPEVKTVTDHKLWDTTAPVAWSDVVTDSVEQIKQQFGVLRDSVVSAFNDIRDRISKGWEALKQGDIKGVISGIADAFGDLWGLIKPHIDNVVTSITGILNDKAKMAEIWKAFKDGLWDGGTWVNKAITSVAEEIKKNITIENAKTWWSGFTEALSKDLSWVGTTIGTIGAGIYSAIQENAPTWWTAFTDALQDTAKYVGAGIQVIGEEIAKEIESGGPIWWKGFQDALYATGTWVGSGLIAIAKDINSYMVKNKDKWWLEFQNALYSTGTWVKTQITAIGKAITAEINITNATKWWANFYNALGASTTWVNTQIAKIADAILKYPWGSIGEGIWKLISDGINGAMNGAGKFLGDTGKGIQDSLNNFLTGGKDGDRFTPTSFNGGNKQGQIVNESNFPVGNQQGQGSGGLADMLAVFPLIDAAVKKLQATFSAFSTSIATYSASMTANLGIFFTKIGAAIPLLDQALKMHQTSWSTFSTSLATYASSLTVNLGKFFTTIGQAFPLLDTMVKTHQQTWSGFSTSISTYAASMTTNLGNFFTTIGSAFGLLDNAVKLHQQTWSTFSTSISTYAKSMTTNIGTFATTTVQNFTKVDAGVKKTHQTMSTMSTSVSTYMKSMASAISSFASGAVSNFNKVTSAVKSLTSAFNSMASAAKKAESAARSAASAGAGGFMHGGMAVLAGQRGFSGIINRPTTIGSGLNSVNAGEDFKPEFVSVQPLTKGTGNHSGNLSRASSGGSGRGGPIVIENVIILDGQEMKRFVQKVGLENIGIQI